MLESVHGRERHAVRVPYCGDAAQQRRNRPSWQQVALRDWMAPLGVMRNDVRRRDHETGTNGSDSVASAMARFLKQKGASEETDPMMTNTTPTAFHANAEAPTTTGRGHSEGCDRQRKHRHDDAARNGAGRGSVRHRVRRIQMTTPTRTSSACNRSWSSSACGSKEPDGFQVLSMLKLDEDTRRIPVLTYTTEYARAGNRRR